MGNLRESDRGNPYTHEGSARWAGEGVAEARGGVAFDKMDRVHSRFSGIDPTPSGPPRYLRLNVKGIHGVTFNPVRAVALNPRRQTTNGSMERETEKRNEMEEERDLRRNRITKLGERLRLRKRKSQEIQNKVGGGGGKQKYKRYIRTATNGGLTKDTT